MSSPFDLSIYEDEELLKFISEEIKSYCMLHGILMIVNDHDSTFTHIPCSVLPLPMRRASFERARDLAGLMSRLYDRVGRDFSFLLETLRASAQADSFIGFLYSLLTEASTSRFYQPLNLTISRSDYMLHVDEANPDEAPTPIQVEMNMISTAFTVTSSKVTAMHRYLADRHIPAKYGLSVDRIPENATGDRAVEGFAKAIQEYAAWELNTFGPASKPSAPHVMVMVVQEGERNSGDQRALEYMLGSRHGIRTLRLSLSQIAAQMEVDENGLLTIQDQRVGLVYYRAGYSPNDLKTDAQRSAMRSMELSFAVKCPSVGHHLAGTKKVQQQLALPGVLEHFLTAEEADKIRVLFTGLFSLDREDIVQDAISNPNKYVLKPQREGGGNNLWGEEIPAKLRSAGEEEKAAFILMERINSLTKKQIMLKNGHVAHVQGVSELGIYTVNLSTSVQNQNEKKEIIEVTNEYSGFLLRTKSEDSNEGGVASGFAVLDAPILY